MLTKLQKFGLLKASRCRAPEAFQEQLGAMPCLAGAGVESGWHVFSPCNSTGIIDAWGLSTTVLLADTVPPHFPAS